MIYEYNLFKYLYRIPFAREWALICVRNICEGNKTNQEYIQALQPQKVIHDEFLEKLGVNVQIDTMTGKISAVSTEVEK
jgi:hypothetical protein